jgi:hypothetical protein
MDFAPNSQFHLPLLGRLDGPSVVPQQLLAKAKTYREAVRLCWAKRRVHGMTLRQLAAEGCFYPQHVGDWLNPDDHPKRRSLPADEIEIFESVVGNTFVSQWIASRSKLTVLEEMMATKAAA